VADHLIDKVGDLLREVAATAILPVFRQLDESDVAEKAPGEVVTVADRRSEQLLGAGLERLLPGSVVVGEEGVAADPATLDRLHGDGPVWVVDPLDGTANFAAGQRPFAVMVALRHAGATRAAWILDPIEDTLTVAEAGSGAYVDGVPLRSTPDQPPIAALRGAVSRYLPGQLRAGMVAGLGQLGEVGPGQHCAGWEYPQVASGSQHFVLFWRTLPWDHLPGVLLVEEAGGVARRFDGDPYDPTDDRQGLLVAANEAIWATVHETLLAPTG
jgi:fructose-1,6-bisphosphatase/inositol monophosphatase family enzyme